MLCFTFFEKFIYKTKVVHQAPGWAVVHLPLVSGRQGFVFDLLWAFALPCTLCFGIAMSPDFPERENQ